MLWKSNGVSSLGVSANACLDGLDDKDHCKATVKKAASTINSVPLL